MSTRTVSFQFGGDHLEAFRNRYRAIYLAPPSESSRLI